MTRTLHIMTTHLLRLLALGTAGMLCLSARADLFQVTYDFAGGSGAAVVSGAGAAGVNAGAFTPVGNAALSSTFEEAVMRSDYTGFDLNAALADSDYFTFTLTAANPANPFNLNDFTLSFGVVSGSQFDSDIFSHLVVQSSIGGFGSGNPTLGISDDTVYLNTFPGSVYENPSVTVSGLAFDALTSITFQVRIWDTRNDTSEATRLDNLILSGDVTVIPEPSTMALVALGMAAVFARFRRHQSN